MELLKSLNPLVPEAMEPFRGVSIIKFMRRFPSDKECSDYISYFRWENGYECPRCGSTKYWIGQDTYVKVCKVCRKKESITSSTAFHKQKIGLQKAFMIIFEVATTSKSMSSNQMSKRLEMNYDSAWLFMMKVRSVLKSSGFYKLEGDVMVDEIVIGGHEEGAKGRKTDTKKTKIVIAIEVRNNYEVSRAYAMVIEDYSSEELRKIFDSRIDKTATILTDKWTGYAPLMGEYNITQEKSKGGTNFEAMNRFIMTLKSWIRGIHHHVSKYHMQAYLDEYCYRYNRNASKDKIFHNAIMRMINAGETNFKMISEPKLPTREQTNERLRLDLVNQRELEEKQREKAERKRKKIA